ncbi:MAG: hypothetical protein KME31_37885 [Tolypothrix carrinoi HA7290-LM1]|jgi:hypothetical protein|nr:hypothetical protein [Tolypothrix carrinoi HA7290-LM1]
MINQQEIFWLHSESLNIEFKSDYVPLISFKKKEQKEAAENYILEETTEFFENILKLSISVAQNQLAYPIVINHKDFKYENIEYFYEYFFHDLGERKSDGKLKEKIKWGITFDEECAPIQVAKHYFDSKSQEVRLEYFDARKGRPRIPYRPFYRNYLPYRRYGTIDINGTPIFYYIHFTLQEILDVIKQTPEIKIH